MNATQDTIRENLYYWFDSEFFAIGIFAFAGVAIRVGVTNEFRTEHGVESDMESYGAFLQLFYSQPYLLANVIGCFIIGICLKEFKTIHGVSAGLFKGLTTGFCGSITTFSSWINTTNDRTYNNVTWSYIFQMIIIEYCITWAAFSLGMMFIDLKNEYLQNFPQDQSQQKIPSNHAIPAQEPVNEVNREEFTYEHIQATLEESLPNHGQENLHFEGIELPPSREITPPPAEQTTSSVCIGDPEESGKSIRKQSNYWETLYANDFRLLWCFLFLLISIPIWFTLIFQSSQSFYTHNHYYRDTLRSIGLGPLGAWLRWSFTRSLTLKTTLPDMHLYTFTANMLATIIQCALLVWGSKENTWIVPINQGNCITLSHFSPYTNFLMGLYVLT